MEEFSVPLDREEIPILSTKEASKEAFYAIASSSTSVDPISDYQLAQNDLITKGKSDLVEKEKQDWKVENDKLNKENLIGILEDTTYSPQLKKAIVQSTILTGNVLPELKDRYIQKTAIQDTSLTEEDKLLQDDRIEQLALHVSRNKKEEHRELINNGINDTLTNLAATTFVKGQAIKEGAKGVASKFIWSIPAGLFGLISLIKERDPDLASKVMQEVQKEAYEPKSDSGKKIEEEILKTVELLGIPAKKVGEFLFETKGLEIKDGSIGLRYREKPSPAAGTFGEVVFDPVNLLGAGIYKKLGNYKSNTTPKISPSAPLSTTAVANPIKAQQQATEALRVPSDQVAAALGADKGEIIHDWVLPKLIPDQVSLEHPDLTESIKTIDETVRKTFNDIRYNPSLINATARAEETAKVFQIIKESRSPYYIQSMSLINETDKLFEGNAVYGRNSSSGFRKEKDALHALSVLKQEVDLLPEELKGSLDIVKYNNQYYINHQWKKEYDELSNLIFGKDSIQTSVLGMDVSPIARSGWGRWLFPTGRLPYEIEKGAMRGEEHAGRIREILIKPIRDKITGASHKKELDYLINHAEENGIDYYSPQKISGMFPKLSSSQVKELFETHTYWRRQQQYNHNFLNMYQKEKLLSDNMEGIYDDVGNYMGAATRKVAPSELSEIREVWDFESQSPVKFDATTIESSGKTLVRLADKIREKDSLYNYGLVGGKNHLNLLPNEVLPRLPGYSGRKVTEAWYVDVVPTQLRVNGYLHTDKKLGLNDYLETKAAARTKHEAEKIKEQFLVDYPNHIVRVRPERTDNFGRVLTDYQIHQQLLSHSMKRGERLPSLYGPARIEDRMTTLLSTINSISRIGAFRAWDDAFQSAFIKGFPEFTKGKFPQYATEISFAGHMDDTLKQKYQNAHQLFKFYERMKNNETRGDFIWTEHLHGLADILEKWKIPTDALRGKHQNPLMLAKSISTLFYIHLSPLRQRLIQPAQQLEMYAVNPLSAAKNANLTALVRTHIGSEARMLSHVKSHIQEQTIKAAKLAGESEFLDIIEAIKNSGLMQSVDLNTITHGVIREVDRHLVENIPEKIWKDIEVAAKFIPRSSRSIGFDAGELDNRVGNWLQVKDLWKLKNPGKDWKTKEAQEEIAFEATRLSGAFNRTGLLPYQEGILSVFFQFAAINHKMLLNLLQDNATILTGTQRARLAAARFALYGGKYGIPGGAIVYGLIDKSDDPEIKKNAELFKRGAVDYAANGLLSSLTEPDEKPDLAFSHMLSPYSEYFLPYFQVGWETQKFLAGQTNSPRYPAMGMISSFGQAMEDIEGWWITKEVNDKNYKQMFFEAAELASGFNHYTQGLLMLGMRDKVTKMGQKYGMDFTVEEAKAKMFIGVNTWKEEDLWKLVSLEKDINKQKKEMAQVIHKQMMNQRVKGKEQDYADRVRKLNSFFSVMDSEHFSQADKLDVINEVEKLDKQSYTSVKQSILVDHWKYHQEERTKERQQIDDIISRSTDKEMQKYWKALKEGNL